MAKVTENGIIHTEEITLMSERWPPYGKLVMLVRKDGSEAPGQVGDNGAYFKGWGFDCEPHSNILGWRSINS